MAAVGLGGAQCPMLCYTSPWNPSGQRLFELSHCPPWSYLPNTVPSALRLNA
jgi:hypothetical protein